MSTEVFCKADGKVSEIKVVFDDADGRKPSALTTAGAGVNLESIRLSAEQAQLLRGHLNALDQLPKP